MAKSKTSYVCSKCGNVESKWQGQCPQCKEWSTMEERSEAPAASIVGVKSSGKTTMSAKPAMRIKDITASSYKHKPTGIGELDRVLGGGLVPGASIILAGPPGTGKSSILGHVAAIASNTSKVLYISGEESVNQIKLRAERTNTVGENYFLAAENDLSKAMWQIEEIKPDLIIVDSMQTIASPDIDGRAGSPSQVTEVATMFTRIAKDSGVPLIMVGHFTKDGNVAGPRTVEHLVDVVLSFEGEEDSPLRFLRAIKNRFGAADEIGCFEHTEDGLQEVPDPSGLLLGERSGAIAGVCSSIFMEGKRPLPVEIQALVAPSFLPNPRRVTSGLDGPRTLMIQAVVDKRGGVRIADKDIYVSTIAGTKIKEPSVDLATVVAIVSSAKDTPVDPKIVALGEVTLSGEIRKVPGMIRRLQEAIRLGFNFAFVPTGTIKALPASFPKKDIVLVEMSNVFSIVQAVEALGS